MNTSNLPILNYLSRSRTSGFKQSYQGWLIVPLLLFVDFLSVFLAHTLGYQVRMFYLPAPEVIPPVEIYTQLALYLACFTPPIFYFCKLYTPRRELSFVEEFKFIVIGVSLVSVFEVLSAFFLRDLLSYHAFTFSRLVVMLSWSFGCILVFSWRYLVRRLQWHLRLKGWGVHQTLLIGSRDLWEARDLLSQRGFSLVTHLSLDLDLLSQKLRSLPIDTLLVSQPGLESKEMYDLVLFAKQRGLKLYFVPDIFQLTTAKMELTESAGIPLISIQTPPLSLMTNRLLKRGLDLLIASVSLLLLWPLLLVLGILVKLSSPGPIFYRQVRISRDHQPFTMYKFRTMPIDAEAQGPVWSQTQRATPVGRFLRRASLDELPQLFNVLNGSMSFVGPRPERPHFVKQFSAEITHYPDRHLVKPGLTGWAQVNGLRGDTSVAERTQYDLYYIENWSLLFDLGIILKSFKTVIADYFEKRAA